MCVDFELNLIVGVDHMFYADVVDNLGVVRVVNLNPVQHTETSKRLGLRSLHAYRPRQGSRSGGEPSDHVGPSRRGQRLGNHRRALASARAGQVSLLKLDVLIEVVAHINFL